jgi:tetratricopeptide (TPR) repeat protein
MADPLSSLSRQPAAPGSSGEDARIEQLLVTGLDHYFAGEFDTAINLWTRVLFLDRTHDRARAYIERARSAQAEQQRQTEALVHEGLAAFDRGEVDRARSLLSTALARGASHDLALGVLGRIDRLDVPAIETRPRRLKRVGPAVRSPRRTGGRLVRAVMWTVAALLTVALGVAAWWAWTTEAWLPRSPATATRPRTVVLPTSPSRIPAPAAAETYMRRGQQLFASGRLRDALLEIEQVPIGDPLRVEADRLRAAIQRELLGLALTGTASAPTSAERPSQE